MKESAGESKSGQPAWFDESKAEPVDVARWSIRERDERQISAVTAHTH